MSEDELAQNCLTLGGLAPGVGLQFEGAWRGFEYDLSWPNLTTRRSLRSTICSRPCTIETSCTPASLSCWIHGPSQHGR
jgi:hypothetical protein